MIFEQKKKSVHMILCVLILCVLKDTWGLFHKRDHIYLTFPAVVAHVKEQWTPSYLPMVTI